MQDEKIEWKAQWIWNNGESSPRNEWWCFRKIFEVPETGWDEASLFLTADSRYVLYINGERLGRGPVRSWPFEQSYDTYDIKYLLKPDVRNVIAVLVLHFGVSTFSYIRGRGGLLAQLELMNGKKKLKVFGTDSSWKVSRHMGQDSRSPRMACQQAFTEWIDAGSWSGDWTATGFDDIGWESAIIIGPVGMEPWVKVIPRDIPFLTEETVWPVRVESLKKVKPIKWTATVDVRSHMLPDSVGHSNMVGYIGYITAAIRVSEPAKAVIGFPNATANFGPCSLNGTWYLPEQFSGVQPERYLEVELRQGDNLFIMDVTGCDHGRGFHIGIDCDSPFEVVSLMNARPSDTPFVSIGPFETFVGIDHHERHRLMKYKKFGMYSDELDLIDELDEKSFEDFPVYKAIKEAASIEDLHAFESWLHPISNKLVSRNSVLSLCIWKKEAKSVTVPAAAQNMAIPGQAYVVPLYKDGMDTEFILDFGKELSGYISFEVEASQRTILDFYGFEYMRDGWIQHTYDLDNSLRYICRDGRQVYTSAIRRGLRYLMVIVRNAAKQVKFHGVKIQQSNYPVAETGNFQCSDPLLNDIWQISRHTTKLCMEDTFVDCPAYEQVFWVGDSRNEALINYYIFGALDIVRRCLRLVPHSKTQTPLFADQVPSGWSSVIPNWTFFWVTACHEYYLHTGDLEFAREILPHTRLTLDQYLQKLDGHGLLNINGWNMLDWAPMDQPGSGVVTPQNMFMVRALRCAALLAKAAGEEETVSYFSLKAEELSNAINKYLWCDEHNAYTDCLHINGDKSKVFSMQTQVVAYICDIARGKRAEQIESYLVAPPSDFVQIGSPFMAFFYYEALTKIKKFDLMVADMRKNYGLMVENGATTCWEMYPHFSENRANPNMLTRSHCHAWSAAPGYFLGRNVLGVRNEGPGWGKVIIEPQASGLLWARGSVPLPQGGRIDVSWKISGEGRDFHLQVWAPQGVEISAELPEGCAGQVKIHRIL